VLRSCFDLIACTRSTFGNGCILSSFFSFILTSNKFLVTTIVNSNLCTHKYMHTYTYICTWHAQTHMYKCMHVCINTRNIRTRMHACTCLLKYAAHTRSSQRYIHIYIYIYRCIHLDMLHTRSSQRLMFCVVNSNIHTCTHAYMHACTYLFTYMAHTKLTNV
jgi:hypothetical protein